MQVDVGVEHRGRTTVVSIGDEVDDYTAPALRARLLELADGEHDVVVDLAGAPLLTSTALSALQAGFQQQRRHGRSFLLVNPTPHVRKVLEITGLDRLWPVFRSLDQALADAVRRRLEGAVER